MKKIMLAMIVGISLISFSSFTHASDLSENNVDVIGESFTREIDSNEIEIYDEQGNKIDSNDFTFYEEVPVIQTVSNIKRKEVTATNTYFSYNWPKSYNVNWDGYKGTLFYKSHTSFPILGGTNYRVTYAGSIFKW